MDETWGDKAAFFFAEENARWLGAIRCGGLLCKPPCWFDAGAGAAADTGGAHACARTCARADSGAVSSSLLSIVRVL